MTSFEFDFRFSSYTIFKCNYWICEFWRSKYFQWKLDISVTNIDICKTIEGLKKRMIVTVFAPVRTHLSVEKEWKTHHGRKNEALPDTCRRFCHFLLSWCIRSRFWSAQWAQWGGPKVFWGTARTTFAWFTWRSVFRPIRKLLCAKHNADPASDPKLPELPTSSDKLSTKLPDEKYRLPSAFGAKLSLGANLPWSFAALRPNVSWSFNTSRSCPNAGSQCSRYSFWVLFC